MLSVVFFFFFNRLPGSWAPGLGLGMAIFALPADTRPGPTLMGRVLPGPIKNRVGYGFKKKKPETGPDFIKKTQTRPV